MLRKSGIVFISSLITVVGLAVAACGGGEDSTPTLAPQATASPTRTPTPAPQATASLVSTPTATPRTTPSPVATPTPAAGSDQPTGTLRVAVPGFGFETNDPTRETLDVAHTLLTPVYDWVIWHSPDGTVAPGAADRWTMSDDGTAWTLHLRDLRFHDGRPITAEDIKFSLERVLEPAATSASAGVWRSNLGRVEAVSPQEARLHTKQPWAELIVQLSPRAGTEGVVLSKRAFQELGANVYFRRPLGTGPWKIINHDLGVRYTYEANLASHPYRQVPGFRNLEIRLVPEESTRLALLRTGQTEMGAVSPENAAALLRQGLRVYEIKNIAVVRAVFFGFGNPELFKQFPSSNRDVRKALSLAVNRQELVESLLGGFGSVPARSVVIQGVEGFDSSWQPTAYDPARARQLLAEAGYPAGFDIKYWSASHSVAPWMPRAAEAVAGYWSAIGVRTRIVPTEFAVMTPMYRARPQTEVVGTVFNLPAQVVPSPSRVFSVHYSSAGVVWLLPIAEIDRLVGKLGTTVDPQQRVQLIRQIQDMIHEEYVDVPLGASSALWGATERVAEWQTIVSGGVGLTLETAKPRR
ncbi:MAG: ABC transporter substrate-binding protein [Chloroflexi bacterium]|nr:ABC transporter substrate-binding protein [Chloroflexota bacterium]